MMAYASWSVVFGEQPSAAKWNILGTNDSSFNDGTGIGNGAIKPVHLATGLSSSTWAWQTWSPTWTGITPGNGVNTEAVYQQIGKTVHVRGLFTCGTTSSGGAVTPVLTLPVTSKSYSSTYAIGVWRYGSSGLYFGYARWATTTTVSLVSLSVSGTTIIDANLPAAIANGFTLGYSFTYEAA